MAYSRKVAYFVPICSTFWYSGDLYQPSNCSMLSQTMMTTRDFGASPDSPVALPAAR